MEINALITNNINNYPDNIDLKDFKMAFTPSKRKKTRRISVAINGEFTINNITIVKEQMDLLFFNYDYIDFSFSQITQIDLTAMQLLYVIKDIYNPLGKVITMDFDLSKDDRLLAYHSGLNDFLFTKLPENKIQP
jgi:hypothetical protein